MALMVMSKRCDQCLYGKNKIVSDARRKEILRHVARTDGHFICHKATIADREAVCAGDWEARGGGQMGRIAGRLGTIKFVTQQDFTNPVPAPAGETRRSIQEGLTMAKATKKAPKLAPKKAPIKKAAAKKKRAA